MTPVIFRRAGLLTLFVLLGLLAALPPILFAQRSSNGVTLDRLVNADGTLRLPPGLTGTIDPSGWNVTVDPNGTPRFRRVTAPGGNAGIMADTADVHWDNRFIGPSGVDLTVLAMAVMGSDIYFGGYFQGTDRILASGIVKWNPASGTWSPLGSGVNGTVFALAVIDTNLYVGGSFVQAGGAAAKRVAKWNNGGWSSLGTSPDDGVNGTVYSFAVSGTNLYVGGSFTSAGSGTTVNRVARWDGSTWSALGTGVGGTVFALSVSGSDLYAGGAFTTAGGNPANHVARWTGSAWATLGTSPNDGVNDNVFAIAGGTPYLYVGGDFTAAGSGTTASSIARWNGSSWSSLGNGFATPRVESIILDGPSVYAAGSFTASGITAASRIARWDTLSSTWSPLNQGADSTIYCMVKYGTDLYAGGDFISVTNSATPTPANHIAKWTGSSWSDLGTSASNTINGRGIAAIAISGTDIYLGGLFNSVDGIAARNVAKYNTVSNSWTPLGTGSNNGVDGIVYAIAVAANGNVYVGGTFLNAGTTPANRIAMWNGSTWSALGSSPNDGVNGNVGTILISGSNVFVGGTFTTAGAAAALRIARWNGSAWSNLGTGMNDEVKTLEVIGSDLFAGGRFTTAGGTAVNLVARWNGTNWLPLGTPPHDGVHGTEVYALARMGTMLYVGGSIDSAGGSTIAANHVASWNGSTWSTLGNGVSGTVLGLAVSGGALYAIGAFYATGILNASGIARWDTAAGGSWSSLGSGISPLNEGTNALAIAASGPDVYVGGTFVQAGGKPSFRFAHWNPALVTSGIADRRLLPDEFALAQNFPNPFNPATTIRFSLSRQVNTRLEIFNILGERVATLIDGVMNPGTYDVKFDGSRLASGIYFYRLTAPDFVETKRLLLLK